MGFNIVENNQSVLDMDELIKDYNNMNLSVKEIQKKHNIGSGAWQTVLKRLKEHGVTMRGYSKPRGVRKARYYYWDKHSQSWRVYRFINGKYHGFGGYKLEKEAQERVKELKQNNWEGLL